MSPFRRLRIPATTPRARLRVEPLEDRTVPTVFDILNGDVTELRNAITTANTNGEPDTINLADGGLYTVMDVDNGTDGSNGLPAILSDGGNALIINGNGATIERSTVAGTQNFRFFLINGGNLTLNRITLTNGSIQSGSFKGGAIRMLTGTLNLFDSTLSGNVATGVNSAYGGGLAMAAGSTTATIANSTISGNTGNFGGGIYTRGNLTATNVTISDNRTNVFGGAGLCVSTGGVVTLNNSTISGNTAVNGTNGYVGGAVVYGQMTLNNCTVTGNVATAGPAAGGLNTRGGGSIVLFNTIVAGNIDNSGNNRPEIFVNSGSVTATFSLIGSTAGNGITSTTANGNIVNTSANLGVLQNNGGTVQTHALLAGSPAIDAGSNTGAPATDARGPGFNRIISGGTGLTIDMGAYEFQLPDTTTTITSATPTSPGAFGTPVTLTATVVGNVAGSNIPSGTVNFFDGVAGPGQTLLGSGTLSDVGGVATATLTTTATQLSGGLHTIVAVYTGFTQGDYSFAPSVSNTITYQVNPAATTTTVSASPPSPSSVGTPVTFTATVGPAVGGTVPTGTVTFRVDGVPQATVSLANVGGVATASFTTSSLSAGLTHTISALYSGDANFAGSTSANINYTVNQLPTTTSVISAAPASPSAFGTPVTFTATVGPTVGGNVPTGTITFRDGATPLATVNLVNVGGVATATYTTTPGQLTGGVHAAITAVYAGDATYAGSTSADFGYTVDPAATTTTIAAAAPASPGGFGTPVTFTATVGPSIGGVLPTGTVTFLDGATQLGTGTLISVGSVATATFTTTAGQLAVGTRTITAVYAGDPNYVGGTSADFDYTVNPAAATATLTGAPASPVTLGTSVTFTATVGPTLGGVLPTGTVTFQNGPTVLGTGMLIDVGGVATATYTTTPIQLPGGQTAIIAAYPGDANYATAAAFINFTVNPTTSQTTVSSSLNPSVFGDAVTFTATVSGGGPTPTGSVVFIIDGLSAQPVTLTGGSATLTTSNLGVGSHTVAATYSGDNNYLTSGSGNVTQQVDSAPPMNPAPTTTTVSSTANPSEFGQPVTFTATVSGSGPTPTGSVTFVIDGGLSQMVSLTDGSATLTTSGLSVGSHTVTVTYSGDGNYLTSTASLNPAQQVNASPPVPPTAPAATTTTVTASANPSAFGQSVTFTATITSATATPTGSVVFVIDGNPSDPVPVTGGTATLTTSDLSAGDHTVVANYAGSPDFAASSGLVTQSVAPPPPVRLTATGSPFGAAPRVVVRNADGTVRFDFLAYDPTFRGGVTVAVADVNRDGVDDIITGAGLGGAPHVKVFDGQSGEMVSSFTAFDPDLRGGVSVGAADMDGDGVPDIVTGAGMGGSPHVRAFRFAGLREVASFFAFDPSFRGGVNVASGDLTGDGLDDMVLGAGAEGGPVVSVFEGSTGTRLSQFFAGPPEDRNGVMVAVRDLDGDGANDLVARTAGVTRVFDPLTGADLTAGFTASQLDGIFVG